MIGNTKKKQYVAQWDIIYHEMLAVNNLHREVCVVTKQNTQLSVGHEFTDGETKASEVTIREITYMKSHENPVKVGQQQRLHNVFTQEIITDELEKICLVSKTSLNLYKEFRSTRFIIKEKRLSDTIHRNNLKTFKSIKSGQKSLDENKEGRQKDVTESQKIEAVARNRKYDVKHLFQYDLVQSCDLFDELGLMTKPIKSDLCSGSEKNPPADDYILPANWNSASTTYLVDVMAFLRRKQFTSLRTSNDLCSSFVNLVKRLCPNANRIDFVFDTYVDGSGKDNERIRITNTAIEVNNLKDDTPLTVEMNAFWRLQDTDCPISTQ